MKILNKIFTKEGFVIFIIFLFALIIRIFNLGILPGSLHQDEIMNGYVGRFILLNGKDLYGNSWPLLYFDRFGDFPNVIPMYISGLSTFIFGVNEFAIRFPIALFGAIEVIPLYLIAKLVFRDKLIFRYFPSIVLAVLPWHIVLSRATAEGIIGLTIFTFGLWVVFSGITNNNLKRIYWSNIFFLLTYFLYPSFRVLVPICYLGLIFISKEIKIKKILIFFTITFFVFTLFISTTKWVQGRYLQTSLLQSKEIQNSIKNSNEAFSFDDGQNNIIVARVFHNKYIGLGREFLNQYFAYFSPSFLLLNGGLPPRYVVPNQGLIYFSTFLIFILAALYRFPRNDSPILRYMFFLLAIAPIPAALTIDDTPNIHRSVLMILPLAFIISYGLGKVYLMKIIKIPIIIFVIFIFFLESVYFVHQYYSHSSSYKSLARNDANKQTVQLISGIQGQYSEIFMPYQNTISLYYLFFNNNFSAILEGKFHSDFVIDKISNINFVHNLCPSSSLEYTEILTKALVINYGDCPEDSRFTEIISVYRRDSTKAYKFLIKNE